MDIARGGIPNAHPGPYFVLPRSQGRRSEEMKEPALIEQSIKHNIFDSRCLFDSFFFSSRRRHTSCYRDWNSDVCSSDLYRRRDEELIFRGRPNVSIREVDWPLFACIG